MARGASVVDAIAVGPVLNLQAGRVAPVVEDLDAFDMAAHAQAGGAVAAVREVHHRRVAMGAHRQQLGRCVRWYRVPKTPTSDGARGPN